ncbi:MAG: molybdopterin molybdotransferase MoeA [Pyrinomonadaceae bacterium]
MIPISEALKIIEKHTGKLSSEKIDLAESCERVLAEDVFADMDLPPFDRSQMDGFAVRTEDTKIVPARLKIIGESAAGKGFDGKMNEGETVRIMTGARLPKGANAVQKIELTEENKGFVAILESVKEKQNVIKRAEEIRKGERIFEKGETITENMIAPLAAFGYANVKVFQKPLVAILATGSEIVGVNQKPEQDQIRNSNSWAIKILAEKCGAKVEVLPMVKDDLENLKIQIAEAVGLKSKIQNSKFRTQNRESEIRNPESEILIISGGVSVGDYDFTKPALRELGAEIFFEKISLRPGKPTVFAKLNDTLIFGLPGNPVSVAVTFHLFVRRAILQMQGAKTSEPRKGFAVLSSKIKGAKERDSFLPAFVATNTKGKLVVESLRFSGSSNFIQFSRANALVFVPQNKNLEAGEVAEIVFL